MPEADSLVSITPKEGLYFPPPLDRPIENLILIKNETTKMVTFKIKTTAPTCYHVKPRMKILTGGETCKVKITFRPQPNQEPSPQHKFQIEARHLTSDEQAKQPVQAETLWTASTTLPISRVRMNCSFIDSVPPGVHLSYPPIQDQDAQSVMSYASEAPTVTESAKSELTRPPRSPTVPVPASSPSQGEGNLEKEVQNLQQALEAAERARKAAEERTAAVQAECDALKASDKASKAPKRRGFGILKMLVYLSALGGAAWAGREYQTEWQGEVCPRLCSPDLFGEYGVRHSSVHVAYPPPTYDLLAELETGPGLEKPDLE